MAHFFGIFVESRYTLLNLEAILTSNAARRAELEAEAARIEAARIEAARLWRAECNKLRPALLCQAAAKAEAWLRRELITKSEFIRMDQVSNGLILHVEMEDDDFQPREWEIPILWSFKGDSPDNLKVEWEEETALTREQMEHYYVSPSDW